MKIINKIAKSGKEIKQVFSSWDTNQNGSRKFLQIIYKFLVEPDEILNGLKNGLGIILTRDETHLLTKYLDKDHDTKIDWEEFSEKIHLRDY